MYINRFRVGEASPDSSGDSFRSENPACPDVSGIYRGGATCVAEGAHVKRMNEPMPPSECRKMRLCRILRRICPIPCYYRVPADIAPPNPLQLLYFATPPPSQPSSLHLPTYIR